MILETHTVPEDVSPARLSDYLIGVFISISSRKGIKKAIKRNCVTVNNKNGHTGDWVQSGDEIQLLESTTPLPKIYPLDLEICYEDEHIAIINKPAGIVVSGNQYRTIQSALLGCLQKSLAADALRIPRPVHRLDAQTSGLLLIAKTSNANIGLNKLFEDRIIQKTYHAIIIGSVPNNITINEPIDKQNALTNCWPEETVNSLRNDKLCLVRLMPQTGRTHQLRIHMANNNTPILGDKLHGTPGEILKHKGLFLCATGISFKHPITNSQLNIEITIPYKFKALLSREQRRWSSYY